MPRHAGRVQIQYTYVTNEWKTIQTNVSFTRTTGNHDSRSHNPPRYDESLSARLPENRRWVNPRAETEGEGRRFADVWPVTIEEGGLLLYLRCESWGIPFTIRIIGEVQEIGEVDREGIIRDLDLTFGENLVIRLPRKTKFWRLTGDTVTKHTIDLVGSKSSQFLEYVGESDTADQKILTYLSAPPEGIIP